MFGQMTSPHGAPSDGSMQPASVIATTHAREPHHSHRRTGRERGGRVLSPRCRSRTDPLADQIVDLEVKLAYQDRLIRELDALVRTFATRLDEMQRELGQVKRTMQADGTATAPAAERPPHY